VIVGLGAVSLILVGISGLIIHSISELVASAGWVAHSYQVIDTLDLTQAYFTDAQSAERGYVATCKQTLITPFRRDMPLIFSQIASLQSLTEDNPTQQGRAIALRNALNDELVRMTDVIATNLKGDVKTAEALIADTADARATVKVLDLIKTMESEERRLLALRLGDVRSFASSTLIASLAGTLTCFGILGFVFWLIRREARHRAEAETSLQDANIVHAVGGLEQTDKAAIEERRARLEHTDFEKMNEIRARVDEFVKDPETAEALKPWYAQFCKRPCFNDDYLPTFDRSNVTLVDVSATRGVEQITKKGIVAKGKEYEVDCIIYATGYEVSGTYRRRYGFEVYGENGLDLFDHWGQGIRTFHGHSVHGFPNFFIVGWTQVGASYNYCAVVEEIAKHVAHIVSQTHNAGPEAVIEATAEGEEAWVKEIRSYAGLNDKFLESCTPGYFNNEGKFKESIATFPYDQYAPGLRAFTEILEGWRAAGRMEGLEITK
jgi:CHASE3 domain sensor protein